MVEGVGANKKGSYAVDCKLINTNQIGSVLVNCGSWFVQFADYQRVYQTV